MKASELFPSRFLRAADLQDRILPAVIDKISVEDVGGEGRPGDTKPVITLRGRKKQLILNKTNTFALARAYGDELDDWVGKRIEIYPDTTQMQGKIVACIRVRAPLQAADPDSDMPDL